MATELLPGDAQASSLVLLAAAISPRYDLRGALRKTKYGIFNYYSELDAVFLRAGTSMAGTMDRQFGEAAGARGFDEPAGLTSADQALYRRKLHQIKWDPQMRFAGHLGGHMDWTHRPFVRQYLAPLLVSLSR